MYSIKVLKKCFFQIKRLGMIARVFAIEYKNHSLHERIEKSGNQIQETTPVLMRRITVNLAGS